MMTRSCRRLEWLKPCSVVHGLEKKFHCRRDAR
jgi:hypothetical protein